VRFFFQAEDGIRDDLVTGVQTCALPIFGEVHRSALARRDSMLLGRRIRTVGRLHAVVDADRRTALELDLSAGDDLDALVEALERSEERRVGRECGVGWR